MTSVPLTEAKNELLRSIVEGEGFKDYTVDVQSGSMRGDNYLGIINTVLVEDKNDPKKNLNFIIKSAMTSEKLRNVAPIGKAYERETYMYEAVFPEFEKLQKEHGVKNKFTEIAKCLGTLSTPLEECLVLENLREVGYKMWNRKVPMNGDHVAAVFVSYAKFHACCLALKTLKPEVFEEIKSNMTDIFNHEENKENMEKSIQCMMQNGFKSVEGDENATEGLQRYAAGLKEFFEEDMKEVDRYSVVNHGDCWCNNIMFKYEDPTDGQKPTKVCLLDWQISRIGSPVLDLAYFFFTCSSKEVMYDYEKYLSLYHNTLSDFLRDAGCDPDEVFPYEVFQEHWRKFAKFGLFLALMIIKVMVSDSDEAVDLGEVADSGEDMFKVFTESSTKHMEEYYSRISIIVHFMIEQGLI